MKQKSSIVLNVTTILLITLCLMHGVLQMKTKTKRDMSNEQNTNSIK